MGLAKILRDSFKPEPIEFILASSIFDGYYNLFEHGNCDSLYLEKYIVRFTFMAFPRDNFKLNVFYPNFLENINSDQTLLHKKILDLVSPIHGFLFCKDIIVPKIKTYLEDGVLKAEIKFESNFYKFNLDKLKKEFYSSEEFIQFKNLYYEL